MLITGFRFTLAFSLMISLVVAGDPSPSSVLTDMRRIADWQLSHPSKWPEGDWAQAPFWHGLLALSRIPGNDLYRDRVTAVCQRESWMPITSIWIANGNPERYDANDHAMIQTFLELYLYERDERRLIPSRARLDKHIAVADSQDGDLRLLPKNQCKWSWCDALYMSPPAFALMAKATGDNAYLAALDRYWWRTSDFLYDPQERLYFRDSTYFVPRERNGAKIFWGRGNGWVIGGLVRVLQNLPENHPTRARYIQQFSDIMHRILTLQDQAGLWHPSLLDTVAYPAPETSGSAFYIYGMAWGVNEHVLESTTFRPAIMKGWNGLKACIQPGGQLGFVQAIGDSPTLVDATHQEVYGSGAFLLAGSEVYRLVKTP